MVEYQSEIIVVLMCIVSVRYNFYIDGSFIIRHTFCIDDSVLVRHTFCIDGSVSVTHTFLY